MDDLASGRILGEQAARLLDGTGKVAIITSIGATNLASGLVVALIASIVFAH